MSGSSRDHIALLLLLLRLIIRVVNEKQRPVRRCRLSPRFSDIESGATLDCTLNGRAKSVVMEYGCCCGVMILGGSPVRVALVAGLLQARDNGRVADGELVAAAGLLSRLLIVPRVFNRRS